MRFFFFSSRRRHTRYIGDWVQTCALPILAAYWGDLVVMSHEEVAPIGGYGKNGIGLLGHRRHAPSLRDHGVELGKAFEEIGRAAGRGRGYEEVRGAC